MAETKDPIDNLSYLAEETKNAVEPGIESATSSLDEPIQHEPALEKRLLRKIDIWRKHNRDENETAIANNLSSRRVLLPCVRVSRD